MSEAPSPHLMWCECMSAMGSLRLSVGATAFLICFVGRRLCLEMPSPRHPPRGGNVWHRLSVHVRKQEAGSNQTAVIRPLTNTPNPHSCELPTGNLGRDPQPPQDTPGSKPPCNQAEEDDEGDVQRPLWTPTCSEQMQGLEFDLDEPASNLPSDLTGPTYECLKGAVMDIHSSHVSALKKHTAREQIPANEPLSLIPSQFPSAPRLGDFEDKGSEDEELDLLHSYIYDAKEEREGEEGEGEDLTLNKTTLEDSLALSPPSPFRDSVCSGESLNGSPIIDSMFGSSIYASSILQNFAHSSSTL
ncbi:hypothetical protein CHARACLAT_002210 [Characodon lateralis]|uniref:Metabotropic glutamate receptor Homer-binding domain-containing protein n=1 Tax=Characodon lateralis TaxID=208331 RepID=A0ABU7EZM6_9TELE|nr:hypothetical protein [Characodon lateralis]